MKQLQVSFSAGEIAPSMLVRIDVRQYQNGLATCRNFIVRPQGVVDRRFGLQNVGAAYSNSHASRLIPFVYSDDQAYAVEFSEQIVRFWRNGQVLQWSAPIGGTVASVDQTTDRVTFAERHGLTTSTSVQLIPQDGDAGSMIGLTAGTAYTATVVDAYTVSLSSSISEPLSETLRLFKDSDVPRDYKVKVSVTNANFGTTTITASSHGFLDGDAVRLTTTGTLPTGLSTGTTYYVVNKTSGNLQLSLTSGGTALTWSPGSGTHSISRYYLQGDLIFWNGASGAAHGVYYATADTEATATTPAPAFTVQSYDGTLTIPSPFTAAHLPDVNYVQSNDVMTLVHPSYAPRELRRLGATHWDIRTVTFQPTLDAPTGVSALAHRGQFFAIKAEDAGDGMVGTQKMSDFVVGDLGPDGTWTSNTEDFSREHAAVGDILYIERERGNSHNFPSSGAGNRYCEVCRIHGSPNDNLHLREADTIGRDGATLAADDQGSPLIMPDATDYTGLRLRAYPVSASSSREQKYKVTALNDARNESLPSASTTVGNVLEVVGATNTISWTAVSGAVRYRVYREENGVYGVVGESETTTFVDENIEADMGITPPIADDDLSGTDYPRAVGYFEQRRCFAGTTTKPRQLWMTRTGTESDLSYTLPVKDTNRISVALAAREATTIRHIVSLQDMLLLTQQGEWRLFTINSDAIGPETVAVRQQSEVGGSNVRPLVVNNSVVYPDVRGGHIRHLAFSPQQQAYATGDLSLRATHLFDNYTIKDSAFQRSPYPITWFVSSNGSLLGCTYIPEEEIMAWHRHDSENATFESVVSIPEGDQDTLYAIVIREVGGTSYRRVERIVPDVSVSLADAVLSDAAVSFDGSSSTYTASATVTISAGSSWAAGDVVRVTASATAFGLADVDNYIRLTSGTNTYEMQITGAVDGTKVDATLIDALPVALRDTAISTWAYGVTSLTGFSHLEGETVQVVANGTYVGDKTVSNGAVAIDSPAYSSVVGLSYNSDIQTLPQVFQQSEAAGQAVTKAVSDVWMRVIDTAGLYVGPDEGNLVKVAELSTQALSSGEVETAVPSEWTQSGQVMVRQSSPLPATILNMTLEIAAGD